MHVCACVPMRGAHKHGSTRLPPHQTGNGALCQPTAASQHQCFPKTLGKQSLFAKFCSLWFVNRTFSPKGWPQEKQNFSQWITNLGADAYPTPGIAPTLAWGTQIQPQG